MAILLYNTLTRRREEFTSLQAGKVGMYTCGPTVYNFAHIGNFRAYVFEDLLRRHLKYRGYQVTQVMNLTDVEDKIIKACYESGTPLKEFTQKYVNAFFQDLDTLGIERAEYYPAATDHIPEMVALIQQLEAKGHTYCDHGSVYFKLDTCPNYGQLSHFDMEELKAGASGRVDLDEYASEDARDFALWKAYDKKDGDVFWETPFGKGRPGWHIECSAMSMKYLGATFDIHTGGVDNMFPHHENEIAQSECASGQQFVKYWLHCAHLVVEGRKMAKSAGNFYTLRDLLDKGYDPVAIRWVLIATHYRQPNNFSFEALDAAKQSLARLRDFRLRLRAVSGAGISLEEETAKCEADFGKDLDEDLNISGALGVLFEFIRETNKRIDANELSAEGARRAEALLDRLNAITNLFGAAVDDAVPQQIQDLVNERQQARRNKDFARADAIRKSLADQGWIIEDTADGPRAKRAS